VKSASNACALLNQRFGAWSDAGTGRRQVLLPGEKTLDSRLRGNDSEEGYAIGPMRKMQISHSRMG
jgi:hypothetical protein